jgi:CheY-like chemotaxis protein
VPETLPLEKGGTVSVRPVPSGDRKKLRGVFSRPSQPVLLAVDDAAKTLDKIERELRNRYGDDYHVVCESSAEAGMRRLQEFKATGEKVAVVLADLWMPGMTGMEFLARARQLYATVKRALLSSRATGRLKDPSSERCPSGGSITM